jgi:ribosomal protein S18 acetylase RimI-like enzyme
MRRALNLPIPSASLPPGMSMVPFDELTGRACCELMNRVYGSAFGNEPEPFERWWPTLIADAEFDASLILVANAAGTVVGVCHCWAVPFIKDIAVDTSYQGRGLGSALLTTALQEFARRGAAFVDLKTDVDNIKAQSLYRRLGFEIVERVG